MALHVVLAAKPNLFNVILKNIYKKDADKNDQVNYCE